MLMNTELENEITQKITAFTEQDWAELEDLYNRIINHKGSFSEIDGGKEIKRGVVQIPYTIEKPIVSEARTLFLNKHLMIGFDWPHWEEGKAMFRVDEENRFKDITLTDVIKLFIAVMRNDRFCDGAWVDLFDSGDGQRLLKRFLDFKPVPVHS